MYIMAADSLSQNCSWIREKLKQLRDIFHGCDKTDTLLSAGELAVCLDCMAQLVPSHPLAFWWKKNRTLRSVPPDAVKIGAKREWLFIKATFIASWLLRLMLLKPPFEQCRCTQTDQSKGIYDQSALSLMSSYLFILYYNRCTGEKSKI